MMQSCVLALSSSLFRRRLFVVGTVLDRLVLVLGVTKRNKMKGFSSRIFHSDARVVVLARELSDNLQVGILFADLVIGFFLGGLLGGF